MEAQVQNAVEIALNPDAQYALKQHVAPLPRLLSHPNCIGPRIYCPNQGIPRCMAFSIDSSYKPTNPVHFV